MEKRAGRSSHGVAGEGGNCCPYDYQSLHLRIPLGLLCSDTEKPIFIQTFEKALSLKRHSCGQKRLKELGPNSFALAASATGHEP